MTDDFTIWTAELEIRARGKGRELRAVFPLGRTATIRSSGRVRKETFVGGNGGASMSWQVKEFERLQGELAKVAESALDQARKEILLEQLEDSARAQEHSPTRGSFLRQSNRRYALTGNSRLWSSQ